MTLLSSLSRFVYEKQYIDWLIILSIMLNYFGNVSVFLIIWTFVQQILSLFLFWMLRLIGILNVLLEKWDIHSFLYLQTSSSNV